MEELDEYDPEWDYIEPLTDEERIDLWWEEINEDILRKFSKSV